MTSPLPKTLRILPVLAASCVLGGCSTNLFGNDVTSLYQLTKIMMHGGAQKLTLQEAAAVPYASIGISVGDDPESMLVQAGDSNGQALWTSAARIAITTNRQGRIIRSAGFPYNLEGFQIEADDTQTNSLGTVRWMADFSDLGRYAIPIACSRHSGGEETIVILGKNIRTRRVDETCRSTSSELDWSFSNTFWLDPTTGIAWRSIQHIHPKLDSIEIEVLRPPA